MPPRITYNSINVDLDRNWNRFDVTRVQRRNEVQAASGVSEFLNFFTQDILSGERGSLSGQEVVALEEWYEYTRDGTTFSMDVDRDVGTYVSFEGKTDNTNDEVGGTFTRTNVADSAWYLDPSTGLMTAVNTADTARFPAGKYGSGIQVDGAATNLCTRPSDFGTTWVTSNIDASGTNTSETKDPAGTNIADKLVATAANGTVTFDTSTAVGNHVAMGVWLKSNTGDVAGRIELNGTGGGNKNVNFTATPEWQLVTGDVDTSIIYTGNLQLVIRINTNTEVLYAWGAGIYDNTEYFRGTIGATSTSSITRNAEKLLYSDADSINRDKGTVMFWVNSQWDYDAHSSAERRLFQSGAATGTRHLYILMTTSDTLQAIINGAGGTTIGASATGSVTGWQKNEWHHIAVTYDFTVSNGINLYFDGSNINTSTNDPLTPNETGDQFTLGSDLSGGGAADCTFDDLLIRKDVLAAWEIQNIYNSSRAHGLRRNRYSSLILADPSFNPVLKVGGRSSFVFNAKEAKS